MLERRSAAALAIFLAGTGPARADEAVLGYQLGLSQTFTSLISDSAQIFVIPGQVATSTANRPAFRSAGLQSNSQATANLTLDVIGPRWSHALLAGVALGQVIPIGTPEEAVALRQARTTFAASGGFLSRLGTSRGSLSLSGNYALNLNGLLPLDGDGGVAGSATSPTQPGQQVGFLVLNQTTHAATGRALWQVTRARWDLDAGLTYTYQVNALFSLSPQLPGLPGQGVGSAGVGSALGAFTPATVHQVRPDLLLRSRLSALWTWQNELSATAVFPVAPSPTDSGAVAIVPETASLTLRSELTRELGGESALGAQLRAVGSLRVPTSLTPAAGRYLGAPIVDPVSGQPLGLRPDTVLPAAELTYRTRFRTSELRLTASVGIVLPILFQPALGGASPTFTSFDSAVVGSPQPTVSLGLERSFDPFTVQLVAQRRVGIGGLGATAVTSESGSLTVGYTVSWAADRALRVAAGANVARVRSVEGDKLPPNPDVPLVVAALSSDSVGVVASAELPILEAGGFRLLGSGSYSYAYADPTVGQAAGAPQPLQPFSAHTFVLSLRATLGRGALEAAQESAQRELAAFEKNPETGAPLLSARLLNQGRSLAAGTRGERPGQSAASGEDALVPRTPRTDDTRVLPEAPRGTADDDEREADEARAKRRVPAKKAALPDVTQGDAPYGATQGVGPAPTPPPPPGEAPAAQPTPPPAKKSTKKEPPPPPRDDEAEVF